MTVRSPSSGMRRVRREGRQDSLRQNEPARQVVRTSDATCTRRNPRRNIARRPASFRARRLCAHWRPRRRNADVRCAAAIELKCLGGRAHAAQAGLEKPVKYAGVLAPASAWRARIAPRAKAAVELAKATTAERPKREGSTYRPWAELLARTFSVDVLECPTCHRRMKLIALVKDPKQISRFLTHLGEPTDAPRRAPNRGPPFWKSTVLRQRAIGQVA